MLLCSFVYSLTSMLLFSFFFFLNTPPPPEFSPFSLHDALPISVVLPRGPNAGASATAEAQVLDAVTAGLGLQSLPFADGLMALVRNRSLNLAGVASGMGLNRSEEHTSELQSPLHLLCPLLL